MSYVATTGGIGNDEVRDRMVAAVEHRFGRLDRLQYEVAEELPPQFDPTMRGQRCRSSPTPTPR